MSRSLLRHVDTKLEIILDVWSEALLNCDRALPNCSKPRGGLAAIAVVVDSFSTAAASI